MRGADGRTRYAVEAVLVEQQDETGLTKQLGRVFGGREEEAGVSVAFEQAGSAADDGQYLILDAVDQAPGQYVVAVRVIDRVRGATVETQRTVVLE